MDKTCCPIRLISLPSSGIMHSAFYFNTSLSDYDIAVLASATFDLHIQPECRCPPSHPVIQEYVCEDTSGTNQIPRISDISHDVTLINDEDFSTWWQSVNGVAPVNITIDLGGLREALTVAMQFRSLLPQAMVLYYSQDGTSFHPRQYYASDCSIFGLPDNGLLRSSTDVNCITSFSFPSRNQFVEFRVLDIGNRPGANSIENFNLNLDLQEFAQTTHIRLQLINWNSLDPEEQYFAITEVLVYGRGCVCNGHADTCMEAECVCDHNTMGSHCDQCLPLYNDEPWAPGTVSSANPCEPCMCNGHAESCVYSADSDAGICVDCMDNTEGTECESCVDIYYQQSDVSQHSCLPCDCHPAGITDNGDCQRGDNADGSDSGECSCKEFVTGRRCDQCLEGYFNLTVLNPQGCEMCQCDSIGTVGGGGVCEAETGQCNCKMNVVGLDCSSCAEGHFGIELEGGCLACHEQCNGCSGSGPTDCLVRMQSLSVYAMLGLSCLIHIHKSHAGE